MKQKNSLCLIILVLVITLCLEVLPVAVLFAADDMKPSDKVESRLKSAVRIVELQIDAKGKGTLRIDSRVEPNTNSKTDQPKGQPEKLNMLAGAEIERLVDGRFHIIHDFGVFKDLDDLVPSNARLKDSLLIDTRQHALIFNPVMIPGEKSDSDKLAVLGYLRPLQLPITIWMSLSGFDSDPLVIDVWFEQNAKLDVSLFKEANQPKGIKVAWYNFEKQESIKTLVDAELIANDNVIYYFECPIVPNQYVPRFRIGRLKQKVALNRLDVTAMIPAMIGVQLEDRKGQVVVKAVLEGAAANAGVKPGDIVTAVGDNPISDVNRCIQAIRGFSPANSIRLTLIREGQTIIIPVVAE